MSTPPLGLCDLFYGELHLTVIKIMRLQTSKLRNCLTKEFQDSVHCPHPYEHFKR